MRRHADSMDRTERYRYGFELSRGGRMRPNMVSEPSPAQDIARD